MALDKIETLISHNEADLSTWLEKEYTESLVYGDAQAACSEWTQELRETVRQDTRHKIGKE
jgi:putative hydrolase of HD superfamily